MNPIEGLFYMTLAIVAVLVIGVVSVAVHDAWAGRSVGKNAAYFLKQGNRYTKLWYIEAKAAAKANAKAAAMAKKAQRHGERAKAARLEADLYYQSAND